MKAVFSRLLREGITCSFYIDDSFYVHMSFDTVTAHTKRSRELLESLGSIVNLGKPVLTLSQEIIHLGFVINSKTRTVSKKSTKHLELMSRSPRLRQQ